MFFNKSCLKFVAKFFNFWHPYVDERIDLDQTLKMEIPMGVHDLRFLETENHTFNGKPVHV